MPLFQRHTPARKPVWLCFFAASFALLFAVGSLSSCAQSTSGKVLQSAVTYGGDHEIGFIVGYSPTGGPIWGYDQNVRYSPAILRYSFLVTPDIGLGCRCALRYSPEVTALSIMHETAPSATNPAAPVTHYGAGVSPVGFQLDWRRGRKVQPFFSTDAGFIYYADRVLSPQGSQFMYTIDFGGGVNLFTSAHNAVTMGFRYQHLSNANISEHNPGTDADTFYLGYSHFFTHHGHRAP